MFTFVLDRAARHVKEQASASSAKKPSPFLERIAYGQIIGAAFRQRKEEEEEEEERRKRQVEEEEEEEQRKRQAEKDQSLHLVNEK